MSGDPDHGGDDEQWLDDTDAAYEIGRRVLEAVDRLKPMHTCAPGAVATWAFELDDTTYEVRLSVRAASDG